MVTIEDYVARTDGTCGKDQDIIVTFKYDKKDDAITRILKRARLEKSISQLVFELTYKSISFRLYRNGRAIFRNVRSKDELNAALAELLL